MKLDDLYTSAAEVFVDTNQAAGMDWYAGMNADERRATIASFAGNPGFQAALGRVLAVLSAEAGTEAWIVERDANGMDHLVHRSQNMTSALLVDGFTRLGIAALGELTAFLVTANVDPDDLNLYRLRCEIGANDYPAVFSEANIQLVPVGEDDGGSGPG